MSRTKRNHLQNEKARAGGLIDNEEQESIHYMVKLKGSLGFGGRRGREGRKGTRQCQGGFAVIGWWHDGSQGKGVLAC